ncbi:MBL fold metallo-hydrolase [Peptoniphilus catoniae]|uniref:MBL fold metallo-hydrolase n=1 Tax=Peptoniphilus catoniae TaxID=1660341 RepID=UPI0010FECB70|nr:MBL fold metallo-hydrolase [Peptoniphilus catoniae]
MKFCSLSSGSSGNCQYLEYKNTKILIDAGLSGKKIENLLKDINVDIDSIDAIFLTHEHIDHVKGAGVLSRRHNMKIFTTEETFKAMLPITKEISGENIYFFQNNKAFNFKDLYIDPMDSFHDCVKGTCYSIIGNKKISIVTDTGMVSPEMMERIKGSSLYYLESNHDSDMLIQGSYPWSTKQRIMSTRGHLSNDNAAKILERLLSKSEEIVMLSHLSRDNNDPKLAVRTVRDSLTNKNIREGIDYIMEVSPRDSVSTIYDL